MSKTLHQTHNGKVKWFNDEKGFGFITRDVDRKDFFVHFSQIVASGPRRRTLQDGQTVTFRAMEGPKGPSAEEVIAA